MSTRRGRGASAVLACVVLASVLPMSACGVADEGGATPAAASRSPRGPSGSHGSQQDGVTVLGTVEPSPGDGASVVSAQFEVTNTEAEPFAYTIIFELRSAAGTLLNSAEENVRPVAPGRTVVGVVRIEARRTTPGGGEQVRISRVRRVPADEAPAESGACPPSGIRVGLGSQDAAMGLRVVGLTLENCGTVVHRVRGYPDLTLLDENRRPVPGVRVVQGSGGVAVVTGFDDPPQEVTLEPGETATTTLMWRNTVTTGTPVHVPYVTVVAEPGALPVTLTPELDLGTSGVLAVRAWTAGG